jgi:hypothetical protein
VPHRRKRLCHRLVEPPMTWRTLEVASVVAPSFWRPLLWCFSRSSSKGDQRAQPPFHAKKLCQRLFALASTETCSVSAFRTWVFSRHFEFVLPHCSIPLGVRDRCELVKLVFSRGTLPQDRAPHNARTSTAPRSHVYVHFTTYEQKNKSRREMSPIGGYLIPAFAAASGSMLLKAVAISPCKNLLVSAW